MEKQPLTSQRGEIEFREKLARHQIDGEKTLDDEFDSKEMEAILQRRMDETLADITPYKNEGVALGPFIEIGAERCQRSLALENDWDVRGASVDISYHSLKSCDHYSKVLKKKKKPLRVCCDSYNLPFRSDSIPFVFTYQTLHHFPHPQPILDEIYRVVEKGGNFFLGGEPFKQYLHLDLYKGSSMYSEEERGGKGTLKKVADKFLREDVCNETEYGIIENHDIPIKTWTNGLKQYEKKDLTLLAPKVQTKVGQSFLKRLYSNMMGGTILGICTKAGKTDKSIKTVEEALICPSCRTVGKEISVKMSKSSAKCPDPDCGKKYPVVDGIVFLFEHGKLQELYPDLYKKVS